MTGRWPITVITIVRNDVESIRATLESVLAQRYRPLEYIVVDGMSVDGTTDIVREFADRLDRVVIEADRCLSDALNKGAALASGDLILYMNSGDVFTSERALGEAVSAVPEDTDVRNAIFYTDALYVHRDGADVISADHSLLKTMNSLCHQSVLIGTDLQRAYPYDERLRIYMDYDVWLRCLPVAPFVKLPGMLAAFRSGGMSGSDDAGQLIEVEHALVQILNHKLAPSARTLASTLVTVLRGAARRRLRATLGHERYLALKRWTRRRSPATWIPPSEQRAPTE